MEKLRECTLNNEDLLDKCEKWIYKLCESGGHAWTLRIPVEFNEDPDMLFSELIKRFQKEIDIPKHETVEQLYGGHHPQWWIDTVEGLLKIIDESTTLSNTESYIAETQSAVDMTWTEKPDSEGER